MLVKEVDAFGFEPFERFFGHLADMLRPAVQTGWLSVLELGPELRGNDDLLAERKKRFAHQFFVDERAVDFCGIEKRNAELHCFADQRYHCIPVRGGAAMITHAHAAEADSRNFQVAVSKFALLHFLIPFARLNPLVPARLSAIGSLAALGIVPTLSDSCGKAQ